LTEIAIATGTIVIVGLSMRRGAHARHREGFIGATERRKRDHDSLTKSPEVALATIDIHSSHMFDTARRRLPAGR
jgi:hypothetical protein